MPPSILSRSTHLPAPEEGGCVRADALGAHGGQGQQGGPGGQGPGGRCEDANGRETHGRTKSGGKEQAHERAGGGGGMRVRSLTMRKRHAL